MDFPDIIYRNNNDVEILHATRIKIVTQPLHQIDAEWVIFNVICIL